MKIWKNTKILDDYIDDLELTTEKEKAEIVILGSKSIDITEFKNLKGVFRVGVGTDNVSLAELRKRNIKFETTSESTNELIFEETANFTCYLMLHMIYRESGEIEPWKVNFRDLLLNKKLLVIGLGNIGSRVVSKMENFLSVITFDIMFNNLSDMKGLLSKCDIVSLHIPLNCKTNNFFDSQRLSWMKDGALLINTSRAKLVDEEALYNELQKKRLKAAFDVHYTKPYNGKLFSKYPDSFYMTPHVASKTWEYLESSNRDLRKFIEIIKLGE